MQVRNKIPTPEHVREWRRLSCKRVLSRILVPVILACGTSAFAHQPHDVASHVTLSPNYATDGVIFLVASDYPVPHPQVAYRSDNRGVTWTKLTNGLDNRKNISAFSISPAFATDGTVFCATSAEGVYRSVDGGESWMAVNSGLPSLALSDVTCELDAGMNLVLMVRGTNGGLFRSDDLGESWTASIDVGTLITSVAFSSRFSQDDIVLAGSASGQLHASVDGGLSWLDLSNLGGGALTDIAFLTNTGKYRIAFGTETAGILYTENGLATVIALNSGLPAEVITSMAPVPINSNATALFATTALQGVFKFVPGTGAWEKHEQGLDIEPLQGTTEFFQLSGSPNYDSDSTVFAALHSGLFRSTDGGLNWNQFDPLSPAGILGLALSPDYENDQTLALARYGSGTSISSDGADTWQVANIGLTDPYSQDVRFSNQFGLNQTMHAVQLNSFLSSTNSGTTWIETQIAGGNEQLVSMAVSPEFNSDGTIFLGSRSAGIYRSVNGGQAFQLVYPSARRADFMAISPNYGADRTIFAGFVQTGIVRSTDGGANWEVLSAGLPVDNERGAQICLSPDFESDGIVFASTLYGLYQSSDGGDTWTNVQVSGLALDAPVEFLDISPDFAVDGGLVVSMRGMGLFKSTSGGVKWQQVGQRLIEANQELNRIRFSPGFGSDRTIFGSSRDRLFNSLDGGESWHEVNAGPIRHESSTSQMIVLSGGWQGVAHSQASAGGLHYDAGSGASFSFAFSGEGVTWLGVRAPFLGMADVFLDGEYLSTIDLFQPALFFDELISLTSLGPGQHNLAVVALGQKSAASAGMGIVVDALDVIRSPISLAPSRNP